MQSEFIKREFLDIVPEKNELEKIFSELNTHSEIIMNPSTPAPKVKSIKPTPGLCVKSKIGNNEKVFINFCHCLDLPEPPDLTEKELLEILDSEEPSSYRVPMSLGEPHVEKDKAGRDCTCYDIIINSNYFEKIKNSDVFRMFLITLGYEGIQDKYGVNIEKASCIILQNKSYFGVMPEHHIRCKPLIAELGSAPYIPEKIEVVEDEPKAEASKSEDTTTCPEYVLLKCPASGHPKRIVLEASLPNVVSRKTISLSVGEDRVVLHETDNSYCIDIFLPYLIVQEKCSAEFNSCEKVLILSMPVVPNKDVCAEKNDS